MYSWQGLVMSMMFGIFLVYLYHALKDTFLNVGIMITDRRRRKLMSKDKDIEEEIKEYTEKEQAWQSWREQYLNDDPNLRRVRKREELMRKLHESDPNYANWEATIKRRWKKIIESTELEWSDEQEDE